MSSRKQARAVNAAAKRASAAIRAPGVRAQATEGFFLHVFTIIRLTSIVTRLLGSSGFSLTKHRILGLATLTPGITVGEVVGYLRLTHQSVNGPLRQLINEGYVVAEIGVKDRRHKHLFATRKGGRRYLRALTGHVAKFEEAFRAAGPKAVRGFLEVHRHIVDPGDRLWAEKALRFMEKHNSDN
jgi:DNA-binding MarR family transcriptional regulator